MAAEKSMDHVQKKLCNYSTIFFRVIVYSSNTWVDTQILQYGVIHGHFMRAANQSANLFFLKLEERAGLPNCRKNLKSQMIFRSCERIWFVAVKESAIIPHLHVRFGTSTVLVDINWVWRCLVSLLLLKYSKGPVIFVVSKDIPCSF